MIRGASLPGPQAEARKILHNPESDIPVVPALKVTRVETVIRKVASQILVRLLSRG